MKYTVKQLSEMAGISVRTLHHYDEIGVLKPSYYSEKGYRYYEEKELLRLQQILFFKELDFSLKDIMRIIDSPKFDVMDALEMHRKLMSKKIDKLSSLMDVIDNTILKLKGELEMENKELYSNFTKEEMEKYKEEVRTKYCSKLVEECEERTKNWTKGDYNDINKMYDDVLIDIKKNMHKGYDCEEVQEQVGKLKDIVNKFYTCTNEVFSGLGDMYVADERFRAFFEKYHKDMPEFINKAIKEYVSSQNEI